MERCPSCGAHREPADDYCPVCGETLTQVHLSEATGPPWYERTVLVTALAVLFWPAALYALYQRDDWTRASTGVILGVCLLMGLVWGTVV